MTLLRTILLSSGLASAGSALALSMAAQREGKLPWQPVNATSHWLHGDRDAPVRDIDAEHTLVGLVTHVLSSAFWAVPFSLWATGRPDRTPAELVAGGLATAGFASGFDYGVMPRRVSPGWELALSREGVGAGFLGLALGLALGAWLAQEQ